MKRMFVAAIAAAALVLGGALSHLASAQTAAAGIPSFTRAQIYARTATVTVPARSNGEAVVACDDENDVLLYGGFNGRNGGMVIYRSDPLPFFARQTWVVDALNPTPNPGSLSVEAFCGRVA